MLDARNQFAVLVVSCDKYSDLWKPFFKLFWRFWPDCPFNVYLLSNKISGDIAQVQNLLVGDDLSWSDSLRKGVSQLKEEYVFLFLEDLFLYDVVRTNKVLSVVDWILESNSNYVRMNPSPRPDKPFNELVGIISKGSFYRTSTVLPIWRKNILIDLLKAGESAWDFEVHGSVRSDSYDGFYSTWEGYIPVVNCVIRNKWNRNVLRNIRAMGIDIDLTKRHVMSAAEMMRLSFQEVRSKLFRTIVPSKYRRKIIEVILHGKYNYSRARQ